MSTETRNGYEGDLPKVCMDHKVRFPGQNYDKLLMRGPLSDKKIHKYFERGWYSSEIKEMRRERNAKRMAKRAAREGNFVLSDGRLIYSPL